MSRAFRFRVWDKSSKRMLFTGDPFLGYYTTDDDGVHFGELVMFEFERDKYEVMQSTGLRDKNGVEIYEGDLIEGNLFDQRLPTMGTVEYHTEQAYFGNHNEAGLTPLCKINQIVVVGNIYEVSDEVGDAVYKALVGKIKQARGVYESLQAEHVTLTGRRFS